VTSDEIKDKFRGSFSSALSCPLSLVACHCL
jgi:hypothetical protein